MAAADVEAVCRWMWAVCYPGDEQLAQGLTDALAEAALTRIAAASAAQLAVLRDIQAAVAAAPVSAERIEQLDAAVAEAGEGPLYFNVVMMIYEQWADAYRPVLSPDSDDEVSDPLPEADMPPQTPAEARRTGVVRVRAGQDACMAAGARVTATHLCPRSQARMAALLAALASM